MVSELRSATSWVWLCHRYERIYEWHLNGDRSITRHVYTIYRLPDPLKVSGSDIADNWRRFRDKWHVQLRCCCRSFGWEYGKESSDISDMHRRGRVRYIPISALWIGRWSKENRSDNTRLRTVLRWIREWDIWTIPLQQAHTGSWGTLRCLPQWDTPSCKKLPFWKNGRQQAEGQACNAEYETMPLVGNCYKFGIWRWTRRSTSVKPARPLFASWKRWRHQRTFSHCSRRSRSRRAETVAQVTDSAVDVRVRPVASQASTARVATVVGTTKQTRQPVQPTFKSARNAGSGTTLPLSANRRHVSRTWRISQKPSRY